MPPSIAVAAYMFGLMCIGADCATSPRGPIVWLYSAREFVDRTREYSFSC